MIRNSRHIKLNAFTLFESVVAITVITVLIGIGTLIYGNLVEAEKPLAYYQSKEEVEKHYHELQESKLFFNANFDHETYQIEQKVAFHNGNKNLYRVTYIVSIAEDQILVENHLIPNAYEQQ